MQHSFEDFLCQRWLELAKFLHGLRRLDKLECSWTIRWWSSSSAAWIDYLVSAARLCA